MANLCPKCRTAMAPYDHEGVTVDLCQKCHGLWFDTGELRKIEQAPIETSPQAGVQAAASGSLCPRCAVPLAMVRVHGAADLILDECGRCMGVFLDAGELRRIQQLKARRMRETAEQDAELLRQIRAGAESKREWLQREQQRNQSVELETSWASGHNLLAFVFGLPCEEDNSLERVPYAVYGLILAIIGVWLWQVFVASVDGWRSLAMVPDVVLAGQRRYTLITCMFIHGGWLHVLGNLYFLWTFGDNVEDRVGSLPFLGWYLLWGLTSSIASSLLASPDAGAIPHLGASGAIAGAMGAYIVLFPRSRIAVRLFGFVTWGVVIKLPAWWYLGFWIALQFLAVMSHASAVDWWAHIGGFASGMVIGALYRCFASAADTAS